MKYKIWRFKSFKYNGTEKKWKKIINKMIRAFAFYCIYDNLPEDTKSGALKVIKTGMNAFIKYFGELWV